MAREGALTPTLTYTLNITLAHTNLWWQETLTLATTLVVAPATKVSDAVP